MRAADYFADIALEHIRREIDCPWTVEPHRVEACSCGATASVGDSPHTFHYADHLRQQFEFHGADWEELR